MSGGPSAGGDDALGDGGGPPTDRESSPDGVGPLGLVPAGLVQPAAAGVALATAAYVGVFLSITDVVGGSARLAVAVAVAAAAGVAVARVLAPRAAVLVTGGLFVAGLAVYYFSVPASQRALFSVRNVAFDTVSLLTGLSVLRLTAAELWALSLAPVPTFLTWYLAARGRHVAGASVAAGALGFFVLTGDAGTAATLAGVVGVSLAAGLTTLSAPGALAARRGTLATVLAAMVLLSATVAVVPGGATQPLLSDRGTPGIESSIVGTQDDVRVAGSVRLSPEVRFTVESTQESYWSTSTFDRYTGDGWVRTGETAPYDGPVEGPPGTTVQVDQTVTAETDLDAIPAAHKPVSVGGQTARSAQVDGEGRIQPGTTVPEDDTIDVESEVLVATPEDLRTAGTDYPAGIEERYTQLPESTPDRVGELTGEIRTEAGADNPYDTARAVERYLEESKEYSLTVQRPEGDVADAFLFEMDAGYCVYFATTMVAMLRSQDIPARFVTGYGPGERVAQDEWVVRGQDAHAWVQVYVPDHGWVRFDPTPSAERAEARDVRLTEARNAGEAGVDTDRTVPESEDEPASTPTTPTAEPNGNDTDAETNGSDDAAVGGPEAGGPAGLDPDDTGASGIDTVSADVTGVEVEGERDDGGLSVDRDAVGYGLLLLFGVVAGAHHVGATSRAYRALWLRFPFRRRDPDSDALRAYARLEYLLERRYRARRPGETPRAYLSALELRGVDERTAVIRDAYERARYGDGVDRETADAAVRTVRRLALEATPLVRRFL
ncbi:transglutaminase TgpA family protein [Haloparvum sedimenti]|uniref:transglutaminase TgpA family protein n=1 Tax=Haloparvum sedimenti TaxID=1678448 RepID=UPI000A9B5536|nr:transglutaminaseTgpA domain-containing protein [Haloparvum sedimenti]